MGDVASFRTARNAVSLNPNQHLLTMFNKEERSMMLHVKEYKIVDAVGVKLLEDRVIELLIDNWEPIGGFIVYGDEGVLCQTMVRYR